MGIASLSESDLIAFEEFGDRETPMKRHGTLEEEAKAVLFLTFEAFTTNYPIHVDGDLGQSLSVE